MTCFSDGTLIFNYWWLRDSEAADRARERLKALVGGIGLPVNETGAAIRFEEWAPKEGAIVAALKELVSESRSVEL
jgi:hypothetical protein